VAVDGEQLIAAGKTQDTQFRTVIRALQDEALESPGIPMVARKMLADGAKPWLRNVTENGLHEVQVRLLHQIRETFRTIAAGMDSNVEDSNKAVEIRVSELMRLEAQLQGASNVLAQEDAQLEARKKKRWKADDEVQRSQAADKELKEREKARAKDVQVLQNESSYYFAIEEGFKQLVEGTCTIDDNTITCDEFMRELQKLGPEAALLAALPTVLASKPEDRTSFDLRVIDGVKDVLRKTMDTVECKLKATKEAADNVKHEAFAHAAASVKLCTDLDNDIRELQLAEELRKDRAADLASLKIQTEDCRKLLGVGMQTSEASKSIRENFSDVQDSLESLVSAA